MIHFHPTAKLYDFTGGAIRERDLAVYEPPLPDVEPIECNLPFPADHVGKHDDLSDTATGVLIVLTGFVCTAVGFLCGWLAHGVFR